MHVPYVLIVYSSVSEGRFGCFHLTAIVTRVAVSASEQVCVELGVCQGMISLGQVVDLL